MNKKLLSEMYIIIAAVLWGLIGISVTALSDMGLSGIDAVFIRSFTAFCALALYMVVTDRSAFKFKIKDVWCFAGSGIISLMFFNICYFNAMKHTSVGIAAILLYTAPAFVMILSAVFFKEKITGLKIILLFFMFAGCTMVTGVFDECVKVSETGVLFGLGSGLGYAMYSIFGRIAINRNYSSATISLYTFAFCAVASAFFTDFKNVGAICLAGADAWYYIIFIGVVCCMLPYIFYTKGMLHTDNGKASTIAMIEPLVATVVGVIFFGDVMTPWKISGIIIMFASIGFMNLKMNEK